MAEGRFVTKRISVNEQLGGVTWQADLLFTKCIPHLDVDGRITGNPILLKSQVVPLRPEITEASIPDLIRQLEQATDEKGEPLVVAYEVNGRRVLAFPGFSRIQKGLRREREAASKLPPPPEPVAPTSDKSRGRTPAKTRSRSGVGPESAGSTPTQVQDKVQVQDQVQVSGGAPVSESAHPPTWLTPYVDLWRSVMQGTPNMGQMARALKPLHDEKGSERLRMVLAYHLHDYVDHGKAQFVSLPKFASTFGLIERAALADLTPDIPWLNEEAQNGAVPHGSH